MSQAETRNPVVATTEIPDIPDARVPQSDFARLTYELFKATEIPCRFVFPAGEILDLGPRAQPAFTVTFRSDHLFKKGFDEFTFSRAYIEGDIDIAGDLSSLLQMRRYVQAGLSTWFMVRLGLRALLRNPIPLNRESIAQHYSFGDDFYLGFMDHKYHLYSHCYFATDNDSLEDAAERKMETMAQALQLKPGMRLLDIGAGWGAVTRYAGPRGVDVTALTIAEDSHQLHRELIEREGFGQCRVLLEDFLEHAPDEPYDAIVAFGVDRTYPALPALLRASVEMPQAGRPALSRRFGGVGKIPDEPVYPQIHLPGQPQLSVSARPYAGVADARLQDTGDGRRHAFVRPDHAPLGKRLRYLIHSLT